MTGLLERLLHRESTAGFGQDEPRHWRHVPRINLLPRARAGAGRDSLVRAALVAIVVVAIAYVAVQYRGRSADEAATETARTQLQAVQGELATEQAAIEELQGQIDAARKRVDEASIDFQQIAASRANWYGGASDLLETRTEGIAFTSIVAAPGGVIEMAGVAADLGAMSRFQARLRDVSRTLALQAISFESTGAAINFSATLKVSE